MKGVGIDCSYLAIPLHLILITGENQLEVMWNKS